MKEKENKASGYSGNRIENSYKAAEGTTIESSKENKTSFMINCHLDYCAHLWL